MLALERRKLILDKLQAEKRVVVSELSQLYNVSEETIRRDLDKLEKEGLAIKSYGGAVINEDISIDLPFNVRKNQNVSGKQKMAEIAASLVNDGDHIFLDASTTAVFVAKALKGKERLTVITNSLEILLELADVSGWNIISTGGVMKEGYLAFLGSKTDESIRSYYVDKVIISCKALDLFKTRYVFAVAFLCLQQDICICTHKQIAHHLAGIIGNRNYALHQKLSLFHLISRLHRCFSGPYNHRNDCSCLFGHQIARCLIL